MNCSNDEAFELILAKQKPGYSFIDPPLFSDAKEPKRKDKGILIADMNLLSRKQGMLHVLGKALYKYRNGIEKECILLSQLPKGYTIRQKKSKRIYYIKGHPGGHDLNTAMFIPHLIWLEKASSKCECPCTACHSPSLNPNSITLISDLPNLALEYENCTVESFKMLQSVVIKPPNDIYCKTFIVPIPVFPRQKTILREKDRDEPDC
ncbi:hypothetical protein EDC94DRAFT_597740 [Helicostylum pulchrum]|nr:hypothetical protein EDC94DRAFT_597740 [Helicostylum pulchrum]